MKMMKRIIAMLLCTVCLLGLAACGGKAASSGGEQSGSAERKDYTVPGITKEENAAKSGKPADTEGDKTAAPAETAPEPGAAPAPESAVSETMRQMAGSYALRTYTDNEDVFYDYAALENQRIVNGSPSGALTLNEDGTGHMRWLGKEGDVVWDEENFRVDGTAYRFLFRAQTLYIDTPDNERVEFSKASHLEQFEQSVLYDAGHFLADASSYALGEPRFVRYNMGKHGYVLVYVPIENKSDKQMVLDNLYFTTCRPDGTEIAFFQLPANFVKLLFPGETGEFIFPLFVNEETPDIPGHTSASSFPENVVLRIDEVDVYLREGAYQRLDAEITEVISFVDTVTGANMVYRPNGYVAIPEGMDINDIEINVYCFDQDGSIIAFGSQVACESSVNPVNYFEALPGEHRGKFQTNINGPLLQLDFPTERIDRYVVVASSPTHYNY